MMQNFGWVIEIKRPGVNLVRFPCLRTKESILFVLVQMPNLI